MLNLTVACTKNPRFEPLIDGTVTSKLLNLQFVVTTPPELFYRWLGLFVNSEMGIRGLADLRGKRVGVPDYVMTAALWFRSFLKELCGIEPADVSWYVGRTKQFSHGAILGFDKTPPVGVSLTWLGEEQTFDRMLDCGELDAAYGFEPRHDPKLQTFGNIDRYGGTPISGNPRLRKLLADGGRRVVIDYFEKTKIVPANHTIAVQSRLLEEHPWVATSLPHFAARRSDAKTRSHRKSFFPDHAGHLTHSWLHLTWITS